MFEGKTSNGVPIRSTLGMRKLNSPTHWYLVVDRSQVRMFQAKPNSQNELEVELVEEFAHPDGRKHGRELLSDQPGRAFDSRVISLRGQAGAARHAYENNFTPEDRVNAEVAKRAAGMLRLAEADENAEVTVLAGPELLGLIRPTIQKDYPQLAVSFTEKDYAWMNNSDVIRRLTENSA